MNEIYKLEAEDLIKACIYFEMFEKREVGYMPRGTGIVFGTKDKLFEIIKNSK
jgi:hypothetical protein